MVSGQALSGIIASPRPFAGPRAPGQQVEQSMVAAAGLPGLRFQVWPLLMWPWAKQLTSCASVSPVVRGGVGEGDTSTCVAEF